jgi:hypothetical protein
MSKSTIFYTLTDEAPMLATHSFLPLINKVCEPANINFQLKDISLAGRILANLSDYLPTDQQVSDDLKFLGDFAIFVESIGKKYTLCRDLKDNFLLDLAVTAEADFLVTGDKDLLEIKTLENVKILSPTDFINLIL